jgi:hypothetical protein
MRDSSPRADSKESTHATFRTVCTVFSHAAGLGLFSRPEVDRKQKIAKDFGLRARSHFFGDFSHGLKRAALFACSHRSARIDCLA